MVSCDLTRRKYGIYRFPSGSLVPEPLFPVSSLPFYFSFPCCSRKVSAVQHGTSGFSKTPRGLLLENFLRHADPASADLNGPPKVCGCCFVRLPDGTTAFIFTVVGLVFCFLYFGVPVYLVVDSQALLFLLIVLMVGVVVGVIVVVLAPLLLLLA